MSAYQERPDYSPEAFAQRAGGVVMTDELKRVYGLPRRELRGSIDPAALTLMLKTPHGTMRLKDDQAYALKEGYDNDGVVLGMEAGSGKTLVYLLLITLLRMKGKARSPMYICPANAIDDLTKRSMPLLRHHWKIPDFVPTYSYGELSTPNGLRLLEQAKPDLMVLDEAQNLRSLDSARTRRFLRYLAAFPDTIVIPGSGSFQTRALTEFAHLWWPALKWGIPLPADKAEIKMWSDAIGSGVKEDMRVGLGALRVFVNFLTDEEKAECGDELEQVRRGLGNRMAQTPGVVFSSQSAITTPILIKQHHVEVPQSVRDAFNELRTTWELPSGEVLEDNFAFAAAASQLITGFFYRWIWPNNEPIKRWINARRAWHKYVRYIIFEEPEHMLDSKGPVEAACLAHQRYEAALLEGDAETVAHLKGVLRLDSPQYREWVDAKPLYEEKKETVWVSSYLVDATKSWIEQQDAAGTPGIVWQDFRAYAEACRHAGLKVYGGGENDIIHETRSCVASISAHHASKNLQQFSANLILTPPASGGTWEQLIARTHRMGQEAPEVRFDVTLLCREQHAAWTQAIADARYNHAMGRKQRLCRAHVEGFMSEEDVLDRVAEEDPLWIKKVRRVTLAETIASLTVAALDA